MEKFKTNLFLGGMIGFCIAAVFAMLTPIFGHIAWVIMVLGVSCLMDALCGMLDNPIKGVIYINLLLSIGCASGFFIEDILAMSMAISSLLIIIKMMIWLGVYYSCKNEEN